MILLLSFGATGMTLLGVMTRCFQFFPAVVLSVFPVFCQAQDVVVFAAASLKSALDQVIADWDGGEIQVVVSYGGSGAMAQQILRGAPADIYVSAHPEWMDAVEAAGHLAPNGRVDLLGNALVVIGTAGGTAISLEQIGTHAFDRLAMGQTRSVPAGQYGREAFEALGVWGDLAPRVIEVENVQAVVRLVQLREVDFGVVYDTDAMGADGVEVVARFDATTHQPILYPAALLTDAPEALAFFAHLQSDEASAIFEAFGFLPAPVP